jgi:hypothetical protein
MLHHFFAEAFIALCFYLPGDGAKRVCSEDAYRRGAPDPEHQYRVMHFAYGAQFDVFCLAGQHGLVNDYYCCAVVIEPDVFIASVTHSGS